jgi:hypothetical protein
VPGSIGNWRSLTVNDGRSEEHLTWGIGAASGQEDRTGRAFQAHDAGFDSRHPLHHHRTETACALGSVGPTLGAAWRRSTTTRACTPCTPPAGRCRPVHCKPGWRRSLATCRRHGHWSGSTWWFRGLKLRAVSVFEHMSEEVVEAGFARIEAALPSLGDGPQYETSELLVFQR